MRLDDRVKTHLIDKSGTLNLDLIAKKLPAKYSPEVIDDSIVIFHNRYNHHWRKILANSIELFLRDIIGDTFYYDIKKKKGGKI